MLTTVDYNLAPSRLRAVELMLTDDRTATKASAAVVAICRLLPIPLGLGSCLPALFGPAFGWGRALLVAAAVDLPWCAVLAYRAQTEVRLSRMPEVLAHAATLPAAAR